jgi:hypothetical protein
MEIPEIFSAKRLLMVRAPHRNTFDSNVASNNDFKRCFLDHGQPVSENTSGQHLWWNRYTGREIIGRPRSSVTSAEGPRELLRTWLQSLDWTVYAHKFLRTMQIALAFLMTPVS